MSHYQIGGTVLVICGSAHLHHDCVELIHEVQRLLPVQMPFFNIGTHVLQHGMIGKDAKIGEQVAETEVKEADDFAEPRFDENQWLALHATISGMARGGANVIVDYMVAYEDSRVKQLRDFLDGLDVIWVAFTEGGSTIDIGQPADFYLDTVIAGELQEPERKKALAEEVVDFLLSRDGLSGPYARICSTDLPPAVVERFRFLPYGKLLILPGTSSAGKTSLCLALIHEAKRELNQSWVQFGIDINLRAMAPRFNNTLTDIDADVNESTESIAKKHDFRWGLIWATHCQCGPVARLFVSAHYNALRCLSSVGVNVVSDQIFMFPDWYKEMQAVLEEHPRLVVALYPSLETINKREAMRGNRNLGLAEKVYHQMYKDFTPDLIISTDILSPTEEAVSILGYIDRVHRVGMSPE